MLIIGVSILYLLTGVAHMSIPILFKTNSDRMLVAIFGVIYFSLGILLFVTSFEWLPIVALIITVIGGIGGATSYKKNLELHTVIKLFLATDVVIITLLIANLIVG